MGMGSTTAWGAKKIVGNKSVLERRARTLKTSGQRGIRRSSERRAKPPGARRCRLGCG
jgi:hypothetical protein